MVEATNLNSINQSLDSTIEQEVANGNDNRIKTSSRSAT